MPRDRDVDEDESIEMPERDQEIPANWRPGADTISSVQGNDAAQAAEDALAESDLSRGYADARRYSSEAAARAKVGNEATDLDQFAGEKQLGHKGNNYPTYDLSSTSEVASVKTHWNSDGQLDQAALSNYKQDFGKMQGWGREVGAIEQDGKNIITAREAGAPVPPELEKATTKEASDYLCDKGCLRIPDDHVEVVRSELAADARNLPGNYYLPENPTDEQINSVTQRVKGIGLTSSELEELIAKRMMRIS